MQLTCPQCRSVLDAEVRDGDRFDCPICDCELLAGPAGDAHLAESSAAVTNRSEESSTTRLSRAVSDSSQNWECPVCGSANAKASAECRFCGSVRGLVAIADRTIPASVRVPDTVRVGEVLATSAKIFMRHTGLLVVATLLELLLFLVFLIPMVVLLLLLVSAIGPNPGPAMAMLLLGVLGALVIVAWVVYQAQHPGHYVFMLKLARGQQATLLDLFGHSRASVKQVALSFVVTGLICIGLVAFVIPGLIVLTLSWPYGRLVVDRDPPGWSAITEAAQLVRPHFRAVMMLGLIVLLLQYVLSVAFAFLFTVPFGSLVYTVAYLRLSGEPTIVDINAARRRDRIDRQRRLVEV